MVLIKLTIKHKLLFFEISFIDFSSTCRVIYFPSLVTNETLNMEKPLLANYSNISSSSWINPSLMSSGTFWWTHSCAFLHDYFQFFLASRFFSCGKNPYGIVLYSFILLVKSRAEELKNSSCDMRGDIIKVVSPYSLK